MKKAVFTLICSLAFAAGVMAQDAPLDVSKRVADYLLSHHNHNVSKAQDGHTHIDSYYQEWRYVNGVLGVAMLNLADAAGERSMSSLSKRTLTFISNQNTATTQERIRIGRARQCVAQILLHVEP